MKAKQKFNKYWKRLRLSTCQHNDHEINSMLFSLCQLKYVIYSSIWFVTIFFWPKRKLFQCSTSLACLTFWAARVWSVGCQSTVYSVRICKQVLNLHFLHLAMYRKNNESVCFHVTVLQVRICSSIIPSERTAPQEPMGIDLNILESLRLRHAATIIVYPERTACSTSQVSSLRDVRKMLTWW